MAVNSVFKKSCIQTYERHSESKDYADGKGSAVNERFLQCGFVSRDFLNV